MEIKVLNESYNPVMKRKEFEVEVSHTSAGTPERFLTRKTLAEWFNTKLDSLYITRMATGTGTQKTICNVQVYDDQKIAERAVLSYIKVRNLPVEQRKGLKEEEKAKERKAKPPSEKKVEKPKEKEKPAKPEKLVEKPAEKKPEKKETKREESKSAKV